MLKEWNPAQLLKKMSLVLGQMAAVYPNDNEEPFIIGIGLCQ
jgi:hypothetical protein